MSRTVYQINIRHLYAVRTNDEYTDYEYLEEDGEEEVIEETITNSWRMFT